IVLALWVVLAVGAMGGSLILGSPVSTQVSIPGTDAQRAHDLLRDGFGPGFEPGGTVQLIVHSPDGSLLEEPRKGAVEDAVANIRRQDHVVEVDSPFRMGGIASNLQIGVITVRLEGHDPNKVAENTQRISKIGRASGREQ